MADPSPPLWRQAFDAVERRVTPHAEEFVRLRCLMMFMCFYNC